MTSVKQRRTRVDTVQGALDAFRPAAEVSWPLEIPRATDAASAAREMALFRQIVAERSTLDWSDYAVVTAARLASCTAMATALMSQLQEEGPTIMGGKHGTTAVVNPKLSAAQMLQATLTQLARQLGLAVPAIDKKALANSAAAERSAKSAIAKMATDDLLA